MRIPAYLGFAGLLLSGCASPRESPGPGMPPTASAIVATPPTQRDRSPDRMAPTVDTVDRPVEPIAGPTPDYPPSLQPDTVHGIVRIRMVVTAAGTVDSASVTPLYANHSIFITPAIRAVLAWRYRPAESGGHAVPQTVEQVVRFTPPGAPRRRP